MLLDVSIYSFSNNILSQRIEAKTANILNTPWIVKDGSKITLGENGSNENFETLIFESTFNKAKLNSIYSNLDTISFYKIMTKTEELEDKGI